ncbi:MAG: nucleotidyltransferase domain-containing protein [Chloroflexota bacterium]|nr:nucleotidyltransferase domain-containing protein [Chloroflexota bacterium]
MTIAIQTDIPTRTVEALRAALGERLIAVVLFGSQARGDVAPESDWDLLVIAQELPEDYWERHLFFAHALPVEHRSGVSILARTQNEFEERIPSLYLDIALDGKILFDPQHYAQSKLGYIKNLIGEIGLYRERTDAGDLWLWEKQPTGPWALEWER